MLNTCILREIEAKDSKTETVYVLEKYRACQ